MTCIECGAAFVYTADDQEYHQKKCYGTEPKRCPECREARRRQARKSTRAAQLAAAAAAAPPPPPVPARVERPRAFSSEGARPGGGGGGGGGGGWGPPRGRGPGDRPLFETTCGACGGKAQVPFEPKQDRPVYCRDCFVKMKGPRGPRF
ncbi:MAG: zinc-ribbon domain containing protein [Planctomycetes bacterium]|nr:zinc-ribbon domain containing protein [Planctomycetota bacterium]